jgi:Asp-tRNA(Asn)/Glu-tRNA(Gln) amidotransferase C subunit
MFIGIRYQFITFASLIIIIRKQMEKIMPLDLLSSIKGASSSEAVTELFTVISKAVPEHIREEKEQAGKDIVVGVESLRSDEPRECPEKEKEIIRNNFPDSKNGFLVVPKVIDD